MRAYEGAICMGPSGNQQRLQVYEEQARRLRVGWTPPNQTSRLLSQLGLESTKLIAFYDRRGRNHRYQPTGDD
jgi:hypothetical protein